MLARWGIRANGVAPGPIWKPLSPTTPQDHVESFDDCVPLRRPGQPADGTGPCAAPGRLHMTQFGYTMMCEQSRPDQLVRDIRQAEEAGFDFSVISDH